MSYLTLGFKLFCFNKFFLVHFFLYKRFSLALLLQGGGALRHSCQMVYLDTNYWRNDVILKFRVFTENFQLILEMKKEKILDGVNFHKFNKIY